MDTRTLEISAHDIELAFGAISSPECFSSAETKVAARRLQVAFDKARQLNPLCSDTVMAQVHVTCVSVRLSICLPVFPSCLFVRARRVS